MQIKQWQAWHFKTCLISKKIDRCKINVIIKVNVKFVFRYDKIHLHRVDLERYLDAIQALKLPLL